MDLSKIFTIERIRLVCPDARGDILESLITDAPAAFPKAGIDSPVKIAHFIAQIATEAQGLKRLDENLTYTTAERLQKVFGKTRFPTLDSARPFLKNPEKLANKVYSGRLGNGPAASGDGFAYRGSGLIQLTGRSNFHDAGKLLGIKLEENPELARQANSALAIALAYWTKRNINSVAGDASEAAVKKVTALINPKLVGLEDRKAYFKKALKAFAPPRPIAVSALESVPAPMAVNEEGVLEAVAELSGPQWVARFPTSQAIDDLSPPFSDGVRAFVEALKAAGASVRISATYRPKERAYLMHWAWKVGKSGADPADVTPMPGVAIIWQHPTLAKSRTAAKQMVDGYGMVQVAALNSRHTERSAIDMTISWTGDLSIKDAKGATRKIVGQPRHGGHPALIAVGRGYGAIKLVSDPPHWSDDGR